jgi:hypothetical protein
MKIGNWMLVFDKSEESNLDESEVNVGDTVVDFRGDRATVTGGEPPKHEGSTGRVETDDGEYKHWVYPSVYDLKWVEVN